MRLTERQREEILPTVGEVFGDDASVTLFGSRVNDTERGGDIDLMITTDTDAATARRRKVRFKKLKLILRECEVHARRLKHAHAVCDSWFPLNKISYSSLTDNEIAHVDRQIGAA